jgi:hypothetical protein
VSRSTEEVLLGDGFVNALVIIPEVIERADVAGLLGKLKLTLVCIDDDVIDHEAAMRVDRMRDVGVQFGAPLEIAQSALWVELSSAVIAEMRPQMVFVAAVSAAVGKLTTGHGNEDALAALDDLEVADDKRVVDRDRAEGKESLVVRRWHQLDAHFSDVHQMTS